MDGEKCYPLSWSWNVLLPTIPALLEIFKTIFKSNLFSLHYNAMLNPGGHEYGREGCVHIALFGFYISSWTENMVVSF